MPRSTLPIVGFQYKADAERFLKELKERLQKFGLELHPEKTRLIEFGRYAARDRERRGQGKPESFTFLGFTHSCGTTRGGQFTIVRQTLKKRLRAKLQEVKLELKRRMHDPIREVGKWLGQVVRGHNQYYGVPMNLRALSAFRYGVTRHWRKALRRRSQKGRVTWDRMNKIIAHWLPTPRNYHPYPTKRWRHDLR